jgi:hypothetical protein
MTRHRGRTVAFGVAIAVAIVVGVLYAGTRIHGAVTADSLWESVALTGSLVGNAGTCSSQAGELWLCNYTDTSGNHAEYRVRAPSACWTARLDYSQLETRPRRTLKGCIHLW